MAALPVTAPQFKSGDVVVYLDCDDWPWPYRVEKVTKRTIQARSEHGSLLLTDPDRLRLATPEERAAFEARERGDD